MTMPSIAEELAKEYGANVTVTEDPAVGTPVEDPSAATPQAEVTPPATAEGEPTAAGAPPAAEPTGEPQPASTEPSEDDDPPQDPPAPAAQPAEITEEQAQSLKDWGASLVEEAVTKVREEEIPKVQSGLDSRISSLRDENTALQAELTEATRLVREEEIKALTPEEQTKMREGWANEDKGKELDGYSQELDDWHIDLVATQLISEYGKYGVTAESLSSLEVAEGSDPVTIMTNYCKDQRIDSQAETIKNGTATTEPTPATAAQPAPSDPEKQPPAGSKAPSDAGGGGAPPTPLEADGGKGTGPMGNNVASHGWETADKAFAQPKG